MSFTFQLKRKRVGAGFRGSSSLFQTAGDLLNSQKEMLTTDPVCEEEEEATGKTQEMKSTKTTPAGLSPIKASTTSSLSSPSKRLTKKQQKLAEAAKDMRCISQYFGKKQADASQMKGGSVKSEPEEERSPHHSPSPDLTDFKPMSNTSMDVESVSENDPAAHASPSPEADEAVMDAELTAHPELQRYDGRRHSLSELSYI